MGCSNRGKASDEQAKTTCGKISCQWKPVSWLISFPDPHPTLTRYVSEGLLVRLWSRFVFSQILEQGVTLMTYRLRRAREPTKINPIKSGPKISILTNQEDWSTAPLLSTALQYVCRTFFPKFFTCVSLLSFLVSQQCNEGLQSWDKALLYESVELCYTCAISVSNISLQPKPLRIQSGPVFSHNGSPAPSRNTCPFLRLFSPHCTAWYSFRLIMLVIAKVYFESALNSIFKRNMQTTVNSRYNDQSV